MPFETRAPTVEPEVFALAIDAAPSPQAPPRRRGASTWRRRASLAIATGLGAGYVPLAPGTAGTAAAVPLFWGLSHLPPSWQLAITASFTLLAVWAAQRAGEHFGDSDDPHIVSDEIVGYLVTLALLPATPAALALGFGLFRALDQLKPWPASFFDRHVKNGWGNVLDDVAAGLYARAILGALLARWS